MKNTSDLQADRAPLWVPNAVSAASSFIDNTSSGEKLRDQLRKAHNPLSRLLVLLICIWVLAPDWLARLDPTAAGLDQTTWLLLVMSLIAFILIILTCCWLLHYVWELLGLPGPASLSPHFQTLSIWQQIIFYWASYALFLLIAAMCLIAVF